MTARDLCLEEMREAVRYTGWLDYAGGGVKAAIRSAARRLGISEARAKQLWYGEARTTTPWEYHQVKAGKARAMLAREAALEHELRLIRAAKDSSRTISAEEGMGAEMVGDAPEPAGHPAVVHGGHELALADARGARRAKGQGLASTPRTRAAVTQAA